MQLISYGAQDIFLYFNNFDDDGNIRNPTHVAGNRRGNKKRQIRQKKSKPNKIPVPNLIQNINQNNHNEYNHNGMDYDEYQHMLKRLEKDSIKNFIFKSKLKAMDKPAFKLDESIECCVSYRIIENDELYIKCTRCKNNMSFEVGVKWISEKHNCPFCRYEILNIDDISFRNSIK